MRPWLSRRRGSRKQPNSTVALPLCCGLLLLLSSGCGRFGFVLLPAPDAEAGQSSLDGGQADGEIPAPKDHGEAGTPIDAGPATEAGAADGGDAGDGSTSLLDATAQGDGSALDASGTNVVCNDPDMTLTAGAYSNITISPGCTVVTVRLWGGAGGGAQSALTASGGKGGGGGYAEASVTLTSSSVVNVFVGGGGGCITAGSNAGSASYDGGKGGDGALVGGKAGSDGSGAQLGGAGGSPGTGSGGGDGYYGGGGGGTGDPLVGTVGNGGGGGAASALLVDGKLVALAGGGGGGGGAAATLFVLGVNGNDGGGGCGGSGGTSKSQGGGGGGGGLCIGGIQTQAASGTTPYDNTSLPSGQAQGGGSGCKVGGDGYAILSFSR